jgi:hypothetical protein
MAEVHSEVPDPAVGRSGPLTLQWWIVLRKRAYFPEETARNDPIRQITTKSIISHSDEIMPQTWMRPTMLEPRATQMVDYNEQPNTEDHNQYNRGFERSRFMAASKVRRAATRNSADREWANPATG